MLLVSSAIVFFVVHVLSGGSPAISVIGIGATKQEIAQYNSVHGLNRPLIVQYLTWVGDAVRGNLGESIIQPVSVSRQIAASISPTLLLVLIALILGLPLGVWLGFRAGLQPGSWMDRIVRGIGLAGLSTPSFWLGLLLISLLAVRVHALPAGGFTPLGTDPVQAVRSLVLPGVTLAVVTGALISRVARASVRETAGLDFVRTARALGLPPRLVRQYILRGSVAPIITTIGLQLATLFSSTLVIEVLFTVPGVGYLLDQAVTQRDYPMIEGIVLLFVVVTLVTQLAADMLTARLDPRARRS
jgi:peptide/nickel transport system permease protein